MRRPHFIASQAANARGIIGRIIAAIMARETCADNLRAVDALNIANNDRVIDIGCGPGPMLGVMAKRAPLAKIVGIDPSRLMVHIAARRNAHSVKSGQVRVIEGGVPKLAFEDDHFDKALCAHVLYFWENLDEGLLETARVLKPGGQLVLLFRSSADPQTGSFPKEIYTFYSEDEIKSSLARAGMQVISTSSSLSSSNKSDPIVMVSQKPRPVS